MKKLVVLLFAMFLIFVVWDRQRFFVRDPLANVVRDGVKEGGAQVYINYNNDVLIENDRAPMYVEVVEHNGHTGVPTALKCVHYMACLLDADVPTLLQKPETIAVQSMSNKEVRFLDGKRETVVTLR